MSAKEVALEFKTDARTLRKFLRDHLPKDEQPGQGGRYSFTKKDLSKLRKAFDAWGSGKTAKEAAAAKKAKSEPVEDTEVEEIEELEDLDAEAEGDDEAGDDDSDADEDEETEDDDEDEEITDLADLDGPSAEELESIDED